jgi:hypothetical protein
MRRALISSFALIIDLPVEQQQPPTTTTTIIYNTRLLIRNEWAQDDAGFGAPVNGFPHMRLNVDMSLIGHVTMR